MNRLLEWWIGYKLPLVHVKLDSGFKKLVADLFLHPIKRRIAKYYIRFLQKISTIKVVAITGSAGKTTTKEMIASILSLNGNTVFSEGNIDPVFNIPRTILKCRLNTKYLVLEFGVEYPQEMDYYLWLVKPDIGVITNIFPTHTLYFKNREGVFKEKSKIVKGSKMAVLNEDDLFLKKIKSNKKHPVFWFRKGNNLLDTNANAAKIIAKVLNISDKVVSNGIRNYHPQRHRLAVIKHRSGAVVVDDTYNSNPEALIASISYFNSISKGMKKILVVGDMLELGELEVREHKRVGQFIKKAGFEKVYGVGKLVKHITSEVKTIEELTTELKKYLKPKYSILFKASRSIGLDRLVDKLI